MKLTRIEGPATIAKCLGCAYEGIAGSEVYTSASSGEEKQPEEFYEPGPYCGTCAARLVEEDPTRSVTQFYTNTEGTQVDPDIL